MITVLILHEFQSPGSDFFNDLFLSFGLILHIVNSFLYNPTTIRMKRKLHNVTFQEMEDFLFVGLETFLKNFLKHIVAKTILNQHHSILIDSMKDNILPFIGIILQDVLNCPGAMLILSPLPYLIQVIEEFILRTIDIGDWVVGERGE